MNPHLRRVRVLKAMAHPARLRLLHALRHDEACVCHLTALLGRRQPYVSQQLIALRQAGLIQVRREGLRIYYRIKEPRVLRLLEAVDALASLPDEKNQLGPISTCSCPRCSKAHRVTSPHHGAKEHVQ